MDYKVSMENIAVSAFMSVGVMKILTDRISKLTETVESLSEKIDNMDRRILNLEYAPDGVKYNNAKHHFESLQ